MSVRFVLMPDPHDISNKINSTGIGNRIQITDVLDEKIPGKFEDVWILIGTPEFVDYIRIIYQPVFVYGK